MRNEMKISKVFGRTAHSSKTRSTRDVKLAHRVTRRLGTTGLEDICLLKKHSLYTRVHSFHFIIKLQTIPLDFDLKCYCHGTHRKVSKLKLCGQFFAVANTLQESSTSHYVESLVHSFLVSGNF